MRMEADDLLSTIDTLTKQRVLLEKQMRTTEDQFNDLQEKFEKSERELADANASKARGIAEYNELKRLVEEKEAMNSQLNRQKNSVNQQIEETKRAFEEDSKIKNSRQSLSSKQVRLDRGAHKHTIIIRYLTQEDGFTTQHASIIPSTSLKRLD